VSTTHGGSAGDAAGRVEGLLLAAGAGTRMGMPKALVRDEQGRRWVRRALSTLHEGGCPTVTVVLGARADEAAGLLQDLPGTRVVLAADWQDGMGSSLRAGLTDLGTRDADCALVCLVDLPDVSAGVVSRLLHQGGSGRGTLARASYDGRPGHPVLLGRDHWAGVVGAAHGDRGARDYLEAQPPVLVECGDLATGEDVDAPGRAESPAPVTPARPAPRSPG